MLKRPHATVIEIIVLVLAGLVVIVLALGWIQNSSEVANRVGCASHLRQIGQAMFLYANDNHQTFPRTQWVPDAPVTQFTGASAASPWTPGGVAPNDVTAPIFMLMKSEHLQPEVFICPSTDRTPAALTGSNFVSEANLSYSMANPYPSAGPVQYKWNSALPATFALFADINPGYNSAARFCANAPANSTDIAHMAAGNSPNHAGGSPGALFGLANGQNVLFGDGHVEWAMDPFAGDTHDNIYTVSDTDGITTSYNYTNTKANAGPPATPLDSVLLPGATMTVGYPLRWLYLAVEIFCVLLITVAIVSQSLREPKPKRPIGPPPPPLPRPVAR